MSNELDLDTPLVGLQEPRGTPLRRGNPAGVELTEISLPEIINLRGDSQDDGLVKAASEVLGLALPQVPNTVASTAKTIAFWLSPDEWLLRSVEPAPSGTGLQSRLETALAGHFFATTDQSSGYSVIQLHGPKARAVLAKGCPLDLHPSVMSPGQCAQSHYFRASVLLRPLAADGNAWEIIVRRSFADSTARMLLDAMSEYL